MNFYRMTYIREGKPRTTTFVGKNAEWAHGFAQSWCESLGYPLLTVQFLRPVAQPSLELAS